MEHSIVQLVNPTLLPNIHYRSGVKDVISRELKGKLRKALTYDQYMIISLMSSTLGTVRQISWSPTNWIFEIDVQQTDIKKMYVKFSKDLIFGFFITC